MDKAEVDRCIHCVKVVEWDKNKTYYRCLKKGTNHDKPCTEAQRKVCDD